jgi:hypothetical protein
MDEELEKEEEEELRRAGKIWCLKKKGEGEFTLDCVITAGRTISRTNPFAMMLRRGCMMNGGRCGECIIGSTRWTRLICCAYSTSENKGDVLVKGMKSVLDKFRYLKVYSDGNRCRVSAQP